MREPPKRIWKAHNPGRFTKDAPYWRGERAETIVLKRVRGYRTQGRGKVRLAFTGTRAGCTGTQLRRLTQAINKIMDLYGPEHIVFVHGACKGADYEFHMTALEVGAQFIEIWPSTSITNRVARIKRKTPEGVKLTIHRPDAPFKRNADIIKKAFRLLACPKERQEITRSGTWSTVRLAREALIPVQVIKP